MNLYSLNPDTMDKIVSDIKEDRVYIKARVAEAVQDDGPYLATPAATPAASRPAISTDVARAPPEQSCRRWVFVNINDYWSPISMVE